MRERPARASEGGGSGGAVSARWEVQRRVSARARGEGFMIDRVGEEDGRR